MATGDGMTLGSPPFLFPESLIPHELSQSLPPGFTIRPLRRDDYERGFYDCLRVLTWVATPTESEFQQLFNEMTEALGTYYFVVIERADSGGRHIVGTGALVVERKFIHNHGKVGHIEEISIAQEHHRKGLGRVMMRTLDSIATEVGCYKCILNCDSSTEEFYVKCDYHNSGIEMSRYFEEAKDPYHRG
ncbi:hypothetical protein O1611_g1319 [Lasiodiplodia mahajangana]|uniref:Uncharacterized protein n=1 Tax=Lasiodiplodia mahajangana TaxID=1108764 RepID=A0ACC2JXW6_9PEZI|nr:hypothetical protein O1611_g1319 [Lasiodiplodia mahajangana]